MRLGAGNCSPPLSLLSRLLVEEVDFNLALTMSNNDSACWIDVGNSSSGRGGIRSGRGSFVHVDSRGNGSGLPTNLVETDEQEEIEVLVLVSDAVAAFW